MKHFQIRIRPRHLRYMFFIADLASYEYVSELIFSNMRFWGGRYNPIIPIHENAISGDYLEVLKNYDPDYIFYSTEINIEIVKSLKFFNPAGYINLDERPRVENIDGVNRLYFLSQFNPKSKVIMTQELWNVKSNLHDYYKINFGLEQGSFLNDYQIASKFSHLIINPTNFNSIHKIIYEERPINQADLCARNINTKLLRARKGADYNDFELIVARDKTTISDLLYFWNRYLFECYHLMYITVDELNELKTEKYFGPLLCELSINNIINVVSSTLDQNEIDTLIKDVLTPIVKYRQIKHKDISGFPHPVLDSNGIYERDYGESTTTQTLISNTGLIHIPYLSFIDKIRSSAQKWALDITIKKEGSDQKNEIKFPLSTDTNDIIKDVKGRINRNRNLSIILHNQFQTDDHLEIKIPTFPLLLDQLICYPKINGESQKTKFTEIRPHDSSNKMMAFLKAFKYDFYTIEEFFTDIFWVKLFEYLSTSQKAAGDSIEFKEIISMVLETLSKAGITIGPKEETPQNIDNLQLSIKKTLEELCSYNVFYKGFKLKCPKCSSKFWYHVNETKDVMTCKGCIENFELPIEPDFAYKLNDLIKNNIYQTKTQRDGNLTVIRTLSHLWSASEKSFDFSPQINIYDNYYSNKPYCELDLLCLSDGKLIIGEAKHNSKYLLEEKCKSLKSLVEISKVICPDKVILSCYEDQNGKLEKARLSIIHFFNNWEYTPEIEMILLTEPDEFQLTGHRYFYY